MKKQSEYILLLLLSIGIANCGTFIGNPDRVGTDGPDRKPQANDTQSDSNNKAGAPESAGETVSSDSYDELDDRVMADIEESLAAEPSRITKVSQGFYDTKVSNLLSLPLEVNTSSVTELKRATTENTRLPKLATEDFVDYFSDFPRESFLDTFKVSYYLSKTLWNANNYLLTVVIESNETLTAELLDLKSFIQFNPATVSKFKLLGYVNENASILDENLSLNHFASGSRKTLAFEVTLQSQAPAPEEKLFDLELTYFKLDATGRQIDVTTVSHNLSQINISSQAQKLMNASIAFTLIMRGELADDNLNLQEVKSYLETNRSTNPSARWLEIEKLLSSSILRLP